MNRKNLSTPVIPPVIIESDASSKGWGAVLEEQTQTGGVWTAEEAANHINYLELLAAFLATREGLERQSSIAPSGQYKDGLTYQSQWRYNLSPAVQINHHNVDLVHFSEHYIDSRSPPRSPQCDSRPGIAGGQGSLQLDVQPSCVSEDSGEHGSTGGGSVCFLPDKAITWFPMVLELLEDYPRLLVNQLDLIILVLHR